MQLDPAIQFDYMRRLASGPAFDTFLPLPGVGTPDEPAWSYAVKGTGEVSKDNGKMIVSGVLTFEEPDRAKEVMVLAGMDDAGHRRNPIGLYQHERRMPVGRFEDENKKYTIVRSGKELRGSLHMVQSGPFAPLAEQVYGLVDSKVLNGWSPGFLSHWKDYKRTEPSGAADDKYGITRIEAWKPFEWSLVFIPENDRSLVTQVVRKGLSTGSGLKPLHADLARYLSPFADPAPEWVHGCDPLPNDGGTDKTKELPVPEPTVVEKVVEKIVEKEVIPVRVKELADRGEWYERHVGCSLALPMDGYTGKPGQKGLRAVHDAAMFTSLMILKTLEDIDGPAEAAITQAAQHQQQIAANAVVAYKELYGDEPEWAGVTAADLYESLSNGSAQDQITKEMSDRATAWATRTKGWGTAHAARVSAGSAALKEAAELDATKPLTPEVRAKCLAAATALDAVVTERGQISDLSDEREKELAAIVARVDAAEQKNKELEKKLKRARAGSDF